jgi:hypothetical protein
MLLPAGAAPPLLLQPLPPLRVGQMKRQLLGRLHPQSAGGCLGYLQLGPHHSQLLHHHLLLLPLVMLLLLPPRSAPGLHQCRWRRHRHALPLL